MRYKELKYTQDISRIYSGLFWDNFPRNLLLITWSYLKICQCRLRNKLDIKKKTIA